MNHVLFSMISGLSRRSVRQAVNGLTAWLQSRTYSRSNNHSDLQSMSNKLKKTDSPVSTLKNESARQRWELFHRAIAHAKESTNAAMYEAEAQGNDPECSGPLLTIVK
jgi:hypothetical protein